MWICFPMELLGHRVSMCNVLEELPDSSYFHSSCTILLSHQQCMRAPVSPHPCQYLRLSIFLIPAIPVGMKWCLSVQSPIRTLHSWQPLIHSLDLSLCLSRKVIAVVIIHDVASDSLLPSSIRHWRSTMWLCSFSWLSCIASLGWMCPGNPCLSAQ